MKTRFLYSLCFCFLVFSCGSTAFAAKENFQRTKPHVNIGTIGHVDHGKTTLTAALAKATKGPLETRVILYEDIDGTGRIEIEALVAEIRRGHPKYHIHDFDAEGTVKNMVTGALPQDGAILVVSAVEGPMPQTREHILLARQVGVPSIVVFLNKVDQVDDPELLELVELEIRELLSFYEYDGDNTPIIRGSALGALNGERDDLNSLRQLMDALDDFVPRPVEPADKPFLMPVEDVFSITGRGTVATGRIETGRVRVGDEVEIVGLSELALRDVVEAIQVNGGGRNRSAEAGDDVELLLRGVQKEDVKRGQVLAKPGSVRAHDRFKAQAYILTPAEGGRSTPFSTGYRPQFYFRTTDVTGEIELDPGVPLVVPGDTIEFEVQLIVPVAMEEGLKFAIREGGQTVGLGRVTEILP